MSDPARVVLIVDDEDADEIAAALPGLRPLIARDAATALHELRSPQRIDVAVVDMMIHDPTASTGRAVLDAFNRDPMRRAVPKIVLTSDPQIGRHEVVVERFLETHAVFRMLYKPIDDRPLTELLAVVNEALDQPAHDVVLTHLALSASDLSRRIRADGGPDVHDRLDRLDDIHRRYLADIDETDRRFGTDNDHLWSLHDGFVNEVVRGLRLDRASER
jgi:CheY-like chemotaxis protein